MEPHLNLVDLVRDYLDPMSNEERENLDPAELARKFPEIAQLNDEDIHLIAEGYVSRVDYEESGMHGIHNLMVKARDIAQSSR